MRLVKSPSSELLVPVGAWKCGACGSERSWVCIAGKIRCWTCQPPQRIKAILAEEKRELAAKEQSAVDDFVAEDDDIMDYNERHFGVRTS